MVFWCGNCGEPMDHLPGVLCCARCGITFEGVPDNAVPLSRDQVMKGAPQHDR